MKLAVLAAVAALAGCANTPASEVADLDLCRYQLRGGQNAMVAQQEANRRGLDRRAGGRQEPGREPIDGRPDAVLLAAGSTHARESDDGVPHRADRRDAADTVLLA
jgi:hypothetical protein